MNTADNTRCFSQWTVCFLTHLPHKAVMHELKWQCWPPVQITASCPFSASVSLTGLTWCIGTKCKAPDSSKRRYTHAAWTWSTKRHLKRCLLNQRGGGVQQKLRMLCSWISSVWRRWELLSQIAFRLVLIHWHCLRGVHAETYNRGNLFNSLLILIASSALMLPPQCITTKTKA